MRTLAKLAAALLALSAAAAHAQAPQGPQVRGTDLPKLGVGVSLSPDGAGRAFSFPMVFPRAGTGTGFLLEPYFDVSRRTTGDGAAEVSDNSFTLGASASYIFNVFPYAFGHLGGGLALTSRSYEVSGGDDSGTGTSVYALVGGECFLHPRMSLGTSVALGLRSTPEVRIGTSLIQAESSETYAAGLITARFYFK
jgi:hypothetical protein